MNLQLVYSFDLLDNFESPNHKLKFKPSSFLDFIIKRKSIILELKKANNYIKEFKNILKEKEFRNKIKIILNSPVVQNYYRNPKYYLNKKSEII